MNSIDERELDWWRHTFLLRCGPGSVPKVGQPMCGVHLRIMVDNGTTLSDYRWHGDNRPPDTYAKVDRGA